MNDVIWETDELKVIKHNNDDLLDLITSPHNKKYTRAIDVGTDELTAFARYWLELRDNMDVIWDTDDVFVKAISDEAVTAFAKDWLELQAKREPEIAPCPVCGGNVHYNNNDEWADISSNIFCADCNGVSLTYPSFALAVKAWNALPRKGEK
jgi:hypothetical protein